MPARPPAPASRHACFRARSVVPAVALLVLAAWTSLAPGASSGTVVSATIPSATSVGAAGCAPATAGVTEFGTVQPGTTAVTSSDCVVTWGSSNASSMLRAFQADGIGTSMGAATGSVAGASTPDWSVNDNIGAASNLVAFVAGMGAGVRSTSDGGGTWSTTALAQNAGGVSAVPGSTTTAVVVGGAGIIHRTTTTGATWPAEVSPTANDLQAVSMSDATNGFAVGASGVVVRRTTAGGTTWALRTTPPGATYLNGVSAVSPTVAFVVGPSGVLRRTEDGGGTWSSPAAPCWGNYQDVSATDAATAYAVSLGGTITRLSWNSGTSTLTCANVTGPNNGEDLEAVWAVPGTNTVYVAGALGTLQVSTDSGANWQRLRPGTAVDLYGVSRAADGSIWVSGGSDTVSRAPTGTTFAVRRVETTNSTTITDIAASSAQRAIVVGGQVDGGGTWRGALRTTTNGGTAWTNRNSGTTESLFAVSVPSSSLAIAVGDDGTVTRSTDDGASWAATSVAPGIRLWDVDMVDDYVGWAVGDSGTLLRTTNGGASWTPQASTVTTALRGVDAVDANVAFAAGVGGKVLRTINAGATWVSLTGTPSTDTFDDISAVDASTVWVVWGWRNVARTVDAGAATPSWTTMITNSSNDSLSIDASSRTSAWVGSAWGELSRTIDGGAVWTTTALPGNGYAFAYALDALDENTAWTGGGQNVVGRALPTPARDIPDYLDAGPNWGSAGSVFGACLRTWSGANVAPTWTVDASCTASGTGVWKGIPALSTDPSAKVAGATAATTASVGLRFGFKPAAAQAPGRYSAGIAFEVLAPNA